MKEWKLVVQVLIRQELNESDVVECAAVDLAHIENKLESITIHGDEWYVVQEWVCGVKMSERKVKGSEE